MYVRPIPEEGQPEAPRQGFGYISRQAEVLEPPNYRECVFWDADLKDLYFDGMWKVGKTMSFLACIVGGLVMCVVLCTCCVAFQLPMFEGLFWTCMFCFVAQALTFLSWASDLCDEYECTWSSGTGMNITAAMLWVWAANMIKSFPEALPPRGRGRGRKPMYEDSDDPYASRAFDDEYTDYGEESNFMGEDGDYYDDNYDDYDDAYYDDPSQSFYTDPSQSQYTEDQTQYDEYGNPVSSEGYDESQYDNSNQEDSQYQDYGSGQAGQGDYDTNEPYETDYQEPEPRKDPRYTQGRDDDFEPNSHFQGKGNVDDESQFTASDQGSNAFREDSKKHATDEDETSIRDID